MGLKKPKKVKQNSKLIFHSDVVNRKNPTANKTNVYSAHSHYFSKTKEFFCPEILNFEMHIANKGFTANGL